MKKFLLSAALISLAVSAQAYTVVNHVYYDLNESDRTATVIHPYYGANIPETYAGDIVVEPSITFEGVEYVVNRIGQYAFNDNDYDLTSVTLPETIITCDNYAFEGIVVPELVIPNSVTTIGNNAFDWSYLQKITLGSGLQTLGANAFYKCTDLTEVTVLAKVPPTIQSTTFPADIKSNVTLYVPNGTKDTYENAPEWNGFKEYVELPADQTGITDMTVNGNETVRYFNLNGVETPSPEKGAIVIEVRGNKAVKTIAK